MSPRIAPIVVFDMDDFQKRRAENSWAHCPGGGRCVRVINIVGYFVVGTSGPDVNGYLMTASGEVRESPSVSDRFSFLKAIRLTR